MFRAVLLIACCWAALSTAAPAPQSALDAFAGEGAASAAPSLGTFLQTLSTVTDLLNRFSRTFNGPAQYNEFDDVEQAQPRVSLTEEKDAAGGSIYKVTIVRPADSGAKFARQMQSTTAAPSTPAPSAPTASPAPSASPAPPAPPAPPSTTASPSVIAAEVERTLQRRIQEIALQLETEKNRLEAEEDRRELELERRQSELELAGRRAQLDFEVQQEQQERQLELEQRRRELELETALLNQERAVLGQLKADPATEKVAAADQTAAGATITRVIHFQSREDDSEERLLHALRQQNPNIQFVSPATIPRKSAPIVTDKRGRPIRVYYDSPEDSLEDRLRYAANPRLVQVSRPGAQSVYRFADSDEILYSTVQESSQKATAAAQSPAPLVKQPLVVAPAALQSSVDAVVKTDIEERPPQNPHQPKYNTNHELFSDEDDEQDEVDASALSPIMFLLKKNGFHNQQLRRESLESLEDINKSGNRLDDDAAGDMTEFEREWHYHPQPPQLDDDMRVNRIFRTRNVNYHNPEAESFDVQETRSVPVYYNRGGQRHPIK